jgi:hypothetical protein
MTAGVNLRLWGDISAGGGHTTLLKSETFIIKNFPFETEDLPEVSGRSQTSGCASVVESFSFEAKGSRHA